MNPSQYAPWQSPAFPLTDQLFPCHSESVAEESAARFGDRLHRRKSAIRALFSCLPFSGSMFASQWRCVLGALRGCRSYARFANPVRTATLLARGGGLTNCIGDHP